MINKYILLFTFLSFLFIACDKQDTFQTRMEDERRERAAYLEKNGITKENLEDEGIYYQELSSNVDDKAKKVEIGDEVVIYYTGHLLNGLVFDTNVLSGKYEPMTIRIQNTLMGQIIRQGAVAGNVITGWPPALLKMKEGTKARIVVPSNRAYGVFGNGKIPGYTTLVFEIEVEEVRKKS